MNFDKKIKLCLVVSGIATGGVESFIKNYFKQINVDYFDLYIITHNIPTISVRNEFEKIGFKIICVPPKRKNLLKNIFLIRKYIRENEFDVVHSHMVKSNFIPMYFAKKYNVRLRMAHSHNTIPVKNIFLKKMLTLIQYLNRKYANCFLACSQDALVFGFGKKIFSEKYNYKIIYNAIDIEKFNFDIEIRNEIRKKLNIDDNEFVIGNIARFTKQKNHTFLIDVFDDVIKVKKNYRLILIGDGEEKENIIKKVKLKNLDKYVIFLEPTDDVYKYYSSFDLFILPSKYEGLGMSIIEVQANGFEAIISNNIPTEVIQSDKVYQLPLENKEIWVNKILNSKINLNRDNSILNNFYDIKKTYLELENIYRSFEDYE